MNMDIRTQKDNLETGRTGGFGGRARRADAMNERSGRWRGEAAHRGREKRQRRRRRGTERKICI
jgi:hypothetical protein